MASTGHLLAVRMAYSATQFQFTHLLQQVYDRLEQTQGLSATGGTTASIIDTGISTDVQDDDYKDMYAFIAYDAGRCGRGSRR
jgi:hypothetical protein